MEELILRLIGHIEMSQTKSNVSLPKRPLLRRKGTAFQLTAGRLADGEEPSKVEQKSTNQGRKQKSKMATSKRQPATDEDVSTQKRGGGREEPSRGGGNSRKEQPSTNNPTKNKKNDNTLKGGNAISKEINNVVDEYVAGCGFQKLEEEHASLLKVVAEPKECEKFAQNKERNRSQEIPCLDKTRIVLEPKEDEKDSNDYVHANKVVIEGIDHEYVIAQAPLKNTTEDFWRMVFQTQSSAIVVICLCFEDGKETSEQFWPQATGDYKYYGKMFINNKKTEHTGNGTFYTVEVLPDGCSNSLVTKIYHFFAWEANACITGHRRMLLRLMRTVKLEGGPLTVVSNEGIGRACAYVLLEAVTTRIFKGMPTKSLDVAMAIRKQRAHAFQNPMIYQTVVHIVLDYIRAKVPKHEQAYAAMTKAFNDKYFYPQQQ